MLTSPLSHSSVFISSACTPLVTSQIQFASGRYNLGANTREMCKNSVPSPYMTQYNKANATRLKASSATIELYNVHIRNKYMPIYLKHAWAIIIQTCRYMYLSVRSWPRREHLLLAPSRDQSWAMTSVATSWPWPSANSRSMLSCATKLRVYTVYLM